MLVMLSGKINTTTAHYKNSSVSLSIHEECNGTVCIDFSSLDKFESFVNDLRKGLIEATLSCENREDSIINLPPDDVIKVGNMQVSGGHSDAV